MCVESCYLTDVHPILKASARFVHETVNFDKILSGANTCICTKKKQMQMFFYQWLETN